MLRRAFTLACALSWTMTLGVGPSRADVVVRIGYLRGTEPLNLVRLQGTLDKALAGTGARAEWKGPFPAFAPVAEGLNANALDIGIASSTAALTSIAGDAPISFFGYEWDTGETMGLVVKNGSPIKSVGDLVGKTVAVNRGGSGEYLLYRALEKAGVPQTAVKKAYLSPPDSAAALSQDRVDAWAAWSTFYPTALTDLDSRILTTAGDIDSENSVVYVARTDFAKANPKVIGLIMVAMQEANSWAQSHRDETAKIWEKELKMSPAAAKLIASYRILPAVPIGEKERVALDHQNEWLVQQRILPQKVDVKAHAVTDYGGVDLAK